MTPPADQHRSDPYDDGRKRLITLGFASLGSAAARALHLNVMYFLVQPVCRLGGNWTFHVTTLVLLVTTVFAGWVAWRIRGNESRADELSSEIEARAGVVSFLGFFGVVAAVIFSLAIIVQWVPVFVIGPCT